MGSIYDDNDVNNFLDWENSIKAAQKLRSMYPNVLLTTRMNYSEHGYTCRCPQCKSLIRAEFGDFSQPLAEKFVKCPNHPDEQGHGVWASAVNIVLN